MSFDLEGRSPGGGAYALRRDDEVLGPEPTTYGLEPEEGNLHELQAAEGLKVWLTFRVLRLESRDLRCT